MQTMANIIREIEDYVDELQKQFPDMSKRDIILIIKLGLVRIRKIMAINGSVSVGKKYRAMIGKRKLQKGIWENAAKKARIKWYYNHNEFDNCYYFSLSNRQFAELDQEALKKNHKVTFKKILLYKSPEECWLKRGYKHHMFRVKYPIDCGFSMYKEELSTNQYEYLGNEREKSRNKWIQQGSKSRSKPNITAKQLAKLLS